MFVNCIQCGVYYSSDGGDHQRTATGDIMCAVCADESIQVKKDDIGDSVTYTVSSKLLSVYVNEECYDLGCALKSMAIPFTVKIDLDRTHVFTFAKEHVTMCALAGDDINDLFYPIQ
jgi:hypothetical protein